MTKLLDQAFDVVRELPATDQDEVARAIMRLVGRDDTTQIPLTHDEKAAIKLSKEAMARGEFATDQEVADVWAKHGR